MSDIVPGPGGGAIPTPGRGNISKPRHVKRGSDGGAVISKQRTPSLEKKKEDSKAGKRGLSQSPSVANIHTLNHASDIGEGNDDDQPSKPIISSEAQIENDNGDTLP